VLKLIEAKDVAVLIIAYRRYQPLNRILDLCRENGVERIYVATDGPKTNSPDGAEDNLKIVDVVSNFTNHFEGHVYLMNRKLNLGCAPSVLSACDWVFENEKFAMILEDDCIPSSDFFNYSRKSLEVISNDKRVWLSCGTQFAPPFPDTDDWFLSKYPLTWGWATNRDNWNQISIALKNQKKLNGNHLPLSEKIYWNAGARRAYNGWVDVWDTILAQQLLVMNRLVLLPKNSLVTNIGNDSVATHTFGPSKWIGVQTGTFNSPISTPEYETKVDLFLKNKFFKIGKKHLFTTKFTLMKDFLFRTRKPFAPLVLRWNFAERNRSKKGFY
jgi:hypothetical protein